MEPVEVKAGNPTSNDDSQKTAISAVTTLTVPPFLSHNVRLWFALLEDIFTDHRITTQRRKFNTVTCALPISALDQVADLIIQRPAQEEYEVLKKRLLEVYERPTGTQFARLWTDCELGDQRPSALLRRMRNLAQGHMDDQMLYSLFLQLLPKRVRDVLRVHCDHTELEELAELADFYSILIQNGVI